MVRLVELQGVENLEVPHSRQLDVEVNDASIGASLE